MIRSLFHRSRDRALSTSLSAASKDVLRRHLTLLSPQNLQTLEQCIRTVDNQRIPGDFAQCGIDAGGVSAVLISMLSPPRCFRGYTTVNGSHEAAPTLGPDDDGRRISFHLADPRAGSLSIDHHAIALAHINGGDAEATVFYLNALSPHLSPGGFIIVNDRNSYDSSRDIVNRYLIDMPGFSLDCSIRSSFVLQSSRI